MERVELEKDKVMLDMSLYKLYSGLIFDDKFEDLDPRWVLSPSNAVEHDKDKSCLVLHHNSTGRSTNVLCPLPQQEENLLFQAHIEYFPTEIGDEGGIVVWRSATEKVEFLESVDYLSKEDYTVLRAVKHNNLWSFFAHNGNSWELFDSTVCVDPTMIGFVLKGEPINQQYVPLKVMRAILCKGTGITIGNLSHRSVVQLLDEGGNVVVEDQVPENFSGIEITLPTIPFRGRIQILEESHLGNLVVVSELDEVTDMYGGDVYLRGTALKIYFEGKELSKVRPNNIGSMKNNQIEHKMTVVNPTYSVAENVQIRIAVYNDSFGWTWADLALDDNGSPSEYHDTMINLGTIGPNESKDFWVRVIKGELDDPVRIRDSMRPLYFVLDVQND